MFHNFSSCLTNCGERNVTSATHTHTTIDKAIDHIQIWCMIISTRYSCVPRTNLNQLSRSQAELSCDLLPSLFASNATNWYVERVAWHGHLAGQSPKTMSINDNDETNDDHNDDHVDNHRRNAYVNIWRPMFVSFQCQARTEYATFVLSLSLSSPFLSADQCCLYYLFFIIKCKCSGITLPPSLA